MQKIQDFRAEAKEYISQGKNAEPKGIDFYFQKVAHLTHQVESQCQVESVINDREIKDLKKKCEEKTTTSLNSAVLNEELKLMTQAGSLKEQTQLYEEIMGKYRNMQIMNDIEHKSFQITQIGEPNLADTFEYTDDRITKM